MSEPLLDYLVNRMNEDTDYYPELALDRDDIEEIITALQYFKDNNNIGSEH